MVDVAQLVRVPDCDSGCRGFESHHPPQFHPRFPGPLAQLVEQLTLNQLVEGSNPSRPTNPERRSPAIGVLLCAGRKPRTGLPGAVAALVLQPRATLEWPAFA